MLVEVEITPGKANRARVNRAPVPRPRDVLGILRTVLFAPEDLAMVKGDPSERRRFLDDLLVVRTPRLAGVRADYDRVLRQRNALLKSRRRQRSARARATCAPSRCGTRTSPPPAPSCSPPGSSWSTRCARWSTRPTTRWPTPVAPLRWTTGARWARTCRWSPTARCSRRALLNAISELRRNELDRGISLVGPHRDDLVLKLGPLPAKGYASHGESWSFALALRLAAYDLLRSDTDDDGEPVLILDDVFAELDGQRRERLAGMVAGAEQVLVTAAVPEDVPEALSGRAGGRHGRRGTASAVTRAATASPDRADDGARRRGLDIARGALAAAKAEAKRRGLATGAGSETTDDGRQRREPHVAVGRGHVGPQRRTPRRPRPAAARRLARPAGRRPWLGDRRGRRRRDGPLGRHRRSRRSRSTAPRCPSPTASWSVAAASTAWATQLRMLAPTPGPPAGSPRLGEGDRRRVTRAGSVGAVLEARRGCGSGAAVRGTPTADSGSGERRGERPRGREPQSAWGESPPPVFVRLRCPQGALMAGSGLAGR